jgi:hypothetical protein
MNLVNITGLKAWEKLKILPTICPLLPTICPTPIRPCPMQAQCKPVARSRPSGSLLVLSRMVMGGRDGWSSEARGHEDGGRARLGRTSEHEHLTRSNSYAYTRYRFHKRGSCTSFSSVYALTPTVNSRMLCRLSYRGPDTQYVGPVEALAPWLSCHYMAL